MYSVEVQFNGVKNVKMKNKWVKIVKNLKKLQVFKDFLDELENFIEQISKQRKNWVKKKKWKIGYVNFFYQYKIMADTLI